MQTHARVHSPNTQQGLRDDKNFAMVGHPREDQFLAVPYHSRQRSEVPNLSNGECYARCFIIRDTGWRLRKRVFPQSWTIDGAANRLRA
jgi:hypothetical protein